MFFRNSLCAPGLRLGSVRWKGNFQGKDQTIGSIRSSLVYWKRALRAARANVVWIPFDARNGRCVRDLNTHDWRGRELDSGERVQAERAVKWRARRMSEVGTETAKMCFGRRSEWNVSERKSLATEARDYRGIPWSPCYEAYVITDQLQLAEGVTRIPWNKSYDTPCAVLSKSAF